MATFTLLLNGERRTVDVAPEMPVLWVLRDVLGLVGTKFGCGEAFCGACTVHVDGAPVRACVTQVSTVADKAITTIEGIGATPVGSKVQAAWLAVDVVQCGYCQAGQIMTTSDGGTTWQVAAIQPPAAIRAGSAAFARVCWLVGQGGLVLRTVDGDTWQHIRHPDNV